MADDVVTFGGPARGSRYAEEEIESLFHVHYPSMVRGACRLTGDWELAEYLTQVTYLRLWRRLRWGLISDPGSAPELLRASVQRMAGPSIQRRWFERRLRQQPASRAGATVSRWQPPAAPEDPDATVDTDQAWLDFLELRSRARKNWRNGLAGATAAAVLAAAAIATPLLITGSPVAKGPAAATSPGSYPSAIVARIPVSSVVELVGTATQAWAVRVSSEQAGVPQSYQLVGINLRTNKVTLRRNVGRTQPGLAVAAGLVWLTTPYGRVRGQVVGLDPATGRVVRRVHLLGGGCTYLGLSVSQLIASCFIRPPLASDFVGINPANGQVIWLEVTNPAKAQMGPIVAGQQSVWYVYNRVGIAGLVQSGSLVRGVAANDPAYHGSNARTQALAYGNGSLWVLGSDESVARIDPSSGVVQRVYNPRSYDPKGYGGLNYLAVASGSLWFLDDGYPFSGVIRVSIATGRQTGRVPIAATACGEMTCSQIYATPGIIWVPTQLQLLRINPALVSPSLLDQAIAPPEGPCGTPFQGSCLP